MVIFYLMESEKFTTKTISTLKLHLVILCILRVFVVKLTSALTQQNQNRIHFFRLFDAKLLQFHSISQYQEQEKTHLLR